MDCDSRLIDFWLDSLETKPEVNKPRPRLHLVENHFFGWVLYLSLLVLLVFPSLGVAQSLNVPSWYYNPPVVYIRPCCCSRPVLVNINNTRSINDSFGNAVAYRLNRRPLEIRTTYRSFTPLSIPSGNAVLIPGWD